MSDIFELIESKKVTVEDFNQYIKSLNESLPDVVGFNADRIRRKLNPHRKFSKNQGHNLTPTGINPKSSITPKRGAKGAHVDPTKTRTGRKAAYKESVEFIRANIGKPIESVTINDAPNITESLLTLVNKLLVTPCDLDKDWLYELRGKLCQNKS